MPKLEASKVHLRLKLDAIIGVDTMASVVYDQECVRDGTISNKGCKMVVQICSRFTASYLLP
jgi:hypothetical protein